MLRPAAAYETVLMEKFKQHCYDEDMIYYTGTLGFCEPTIWKNDEYGNCRQYVIINNRNEVIGYFLIITIMLLKVLVILDYSLLTEGIQLSELIF